MYQKLTRNCHRRYSVLVLNIVQPEEVRHGHVRHALMNIPRTKNCQYENSKRYTAKIIMGLGGSHDTESILTVKTNIACFCDFQTAFSGC